MDSKKYAVITVIGYYQGDVQHPRGWDIKIANISNEEGETNCISTLDECKSWLDDISDNDNYLGYGQASKYSIIVEIIDDDIDYQSWLDTYVDWDSCPGGNNYDINCAWAEQQAYDNKDTLPVTTADGMLVLVNLAEI